MKERDHQFHCPACGEEGIITLPDEFMTFTCPAECSGHFDANDLRHAREVLKQSSTVAGGAAE